MIVRCHFLWSSGVVNYVQYSYYKQEEDTYVSSHLPINMGKQVPYILFCV
jgi:hypothetical protein